MRGVRGAFEDREGLAVGGEGGGHGDGVQLELLDEGRQPEFVGLDGACWGAC